MKNAPISATSLGDTPIVAGVAGKRIRVTGYVLSFSGPINVQWTDGPGGAVLGGPFFGTAGEMLVVPQTPENRYHGANPWFETSTGNPLVLNLAGSSIPLADITSQPAPGTVGGHVSYDEVN